VGPPTFNEFDRASNRASALPISNQGYLGSATAAPARNKENRASSCRLSRLWPAESRALSQAGPIARLDCHRNASQAHPPAWGRYLSSGNELGCSADEAQRACHVGAQMPRAASLPPDLKPFARRKAFRCAQEHSPDDLSLLKSKIENAVWEAELKG